MAKKKATKPPAACSIRRFLASNNSSGPPPVAPKNAPAANRLPPALAPSQRQPSHDAASELAAAVPPPPRAATAPDATTGAHPSPWASSHRLAAAARSCAQDPTESDGIPLSQWDGDQRLTVAWRASPAPPVEADRDATSTQSSRGTQLLISAAKRSKTDCGLGSRSSEGRESSSSATPASGVSVLPLPRSLEDTARPRGPPIAPSDSPSAGHTPGMTPLVPISAPHSQDPATFSSARRHGSRGSRRRNLLDLLDRVDSLVEAGAPEQPSSAGARSRTAAPPQPFPPFADGSPASGHPRQRSSPVRGRLDSLMEQVARTATAEAPTQAPKILSGAAPPPPPEPATAPGGVPPPSQKEAGAALPSAAPAGSGVAGSASPDAAGSAAPVAQPEGGEEAPDRNFRGRRGEGPDPMARSRAALLHTVLEVVRPPLNGGAAACRLRTVSAYSGRQLWVHLQGLWAETAVCVGDPVNVIAPVTEHRGAWHAVVDSGRGMLVLHPDLLLSGTTVSGALVCPRQAALQHLTSTDSGQAAVLGTLQHGLLQEGMRAEARGVTLAPEEVRAKACQLLLSSAPKLLEVGLSEEDAHGHLSQGWAAMAQWMQSYMRGSMPVTASGTQPSGQVMGVSKVVEIEENIWGVKYGLKGQIDGTLQVLLQGAENLPPLNPGCKGPARQKAQGGAIVPFEFKTGRSYQGHRAQVLLYLALMEERYGTAPECGLLWYLSRECPEVVQSNEAELAALIQVRNRVVALLAADAPSLPPAAAPANFCRRCSVKERCSTWHSAVDTAQPYSPEIDGELASLAQHMDGPSGAFLRNWLDVIHSEEQDALRQRIASWALPARDRETHSKCIADLWLPCSNGRETALDGAPLWQYDFFRAFGSPLPAAGWEVGQGVVLSLQGVNTHFRRGRLVGLTSSRLTLGLHAPIDPDHLGRVTDGARTCGDAPPGDDVLWAVDLEVVSSTQTHLRTNLMELFTLQTRCARALRARVVALERGGVPVGSDISPPSPSAASLALSPSLGSPEPTPDPLAALGGAAAPDFNREQTAVLHAALRLQDFLLVLGVPGAGKSTMIQALVQVLVAAGRRVLLTAYTNSAVDNILLKLKDTDTQFVRVGRPAAVHPGIRGHLPGGERWPDASAAGLHEVRRRVQVVACTCLGSNNPLLAGRWDVAIVDEASQVLLPAVLGPLLKARTTILVGDHYQLPPIVSRTATARGMQSESLFRRLCEAHPQAVVSLTQQYRMAADVQDLANKLVYGQQLSCGTSQVADAVLQLPELAASLTSQPRWMGRVLAPQERVVFVDTDGLQMGEETSSGVVRNLGEAAVVTAVARGVLAAGASAHQIGAIAPDRAQVALMGDCFRAQGLEGVETLTIDKAQGRDKDCILLSLVRSNAERRPGTLLQDWRRINVAITRARCKLIVVGSAQTVSPVPLMDALLKHCRERRQVVSLVSCSPDYN